MAIGINDIISAGQLAVKLYEWGSSRYTSAYVEYREFMRDIDHVSSALRAVQEQVNAFRSRHASVGLDFSTLEIAVGGVFETLKQCEKLLRDNPKFKWADGFIVNVMWNFAVAESVKALQTRVMFHCTKINLVIQPLQIHIQRGLYDMLALTIDHQDDHFEQLMLQLRSIQEALEIPIRPNAPRLAIPPDIEARFTTSAVANSSNSPILIQNYLDAVIYWYEESTKIFVPEPPTMMRPPSVQYLNLMKCSWLLLRMRQSSQFDRFCHDTLSKAYVRQLERRVDYQLHRFQGEGCLQTPEVEELLAEPLEQFEVCPDLGLIDTTPFITEAQSFELELFRGPLQRLVRNRDRELTLFKSNEDTLRIAISITSPNVAVADRLVQRLDCRKAVVIPIYAHPQNQSSRSINWKASADDPTMEELPFQTGSHVLDFQESVTNFAVRFHSTSVQRIRAKGGAFKMDGRHGTELGVESCVQLWTYKKPKMPPERAQSMASGGTSGSASTRGWTAEILSKSNAGSHLRSTESGSYLDPPVPAKLVLYTLFQGGLRLISVTLDEKTFIDTGLCHCSDQNKAAECKRVCIRQKSKDIKVWVYDAGAEGLSKFNVALLRHPPHEDSARDGVMQSFKFLTLELSDMSEKQKLCESFEKVTAIVRHGVTTYNRDLNMLDRKHVYEWK